MKFGHHGANHPVQDLETGRVVITSQNHGFAVDEATLPANVRSRTARCSTARCRASSHRPAGVQLPGPPRSEPRARTTMALLFDRFVADDAGAQRPRMPKRTDIKSILIIGAGPIVIGQALRVRLFRRAGVQGAARGGLPGHPVNSNPATIMTDPEMADATYIEPITWQMVAQHHREGAARRAAADHGRPDGAELRARPGARRRAGEVRRRADRRDAGGHRQGRGPRAVQARDDARSGSSLARSAHRALARGGAAGAGDGWAFPRSSARRSRSAARGGGIAYNMEEFDDDLRARPGRLAHQRAADRGVAASAGKNSRWRWCATASDNCIIICSIENLDPMGVHTGDSITVAPGADAHRQGIPDHARRLDRGACARSASRPAAPTCSSRSTRTTGAWSSSR